MRGGGGDGREDGRTEGGREEEEEWTFTEVAGPISNFISIPQ